MKKTLFALTACVVVLFSACKKDEPTQPTQPTAEFPVTYKYSKIENQTAAAMFTATTTFSNPSHPIISSDYMTDGFAQMMADDQDTYEGGTFTFKSGGVAIFKDKDGLQYSVPFTKDGNSYIIEGATTSEFIISGNRMTETMGFAVFQFDSNIGEYYTRGLPVGNSADAIDYMRDEMYSAQDTGAVRTYQNVWIKQ